jgi:hypothetical protein
VPAISFEFVPSALDSALSSLDRLEALGSYRFNVAMGESFALEFTDWVDGSTLRAWLLGRTPQSNSGDIYARLAAAAAHPPSPFGEHRP